jgi:hypothetical protein
VDGLSLEVHKIINLFDLQAVMFPKVKSTSSMAQIFRNADVVAAHYFRSLNKIWELYPNAVSELGSQYFCIVLFTFLTDL